MIYPWIITFLFVIVSLNILGYLRMNHKIYECIFWIKLRGSVPVLDNYA